ncbi:MAG TPA: SGNH/GDSL hydrolase family protein, partial [Candidatus Angelobacter sp.]|nr:SGNH/GDSL hydrolase family protein [Candidatus Angelobacter sp.]
MLLGESVARGYFFDPYFNPAMVLQQMLRKAAQARDVDVVDLASIGMLQESLLEVAGAAVDLRPDAVVVLAGNNWWRTAVNLNFIHFQEMAQILRSSGSWADVKAYQEGLLGAHALFGIETLCQLAREHKFHLIITLPEFNLLDWRTSADNPPMLTPAQTIEWRSLREEGERALARHDCDTAKICGLRMLHLDQGTTPEGDNLLGKAHSLAGNWIEARRHYEKARDSVICWPHPGSPRCYSVIQQTIRQEAAKGHFILVDLPQAFTEHWNSGLPDRRMFLDYCHFTVDAAHVAMAAVAEPLLLSLFGIHRNVRDLSSI